MLSLACACADEVPKGSYGVASIALRGADHMDEEAVKACLATHPREHFGFVLFGGQAPQCGVPPFDATRVPVDLWVWPWTERPLWNETAFERDLDRVERWYAARGYYDAKVTDAFKQRDDDAREVDIVLQVHEGEPSLIVRIDLRGIERLDEKVQRAVREAITLTLGDPFDEALYDRSKHAALEALQDASYAKATVTGRVNIDPQKKLVRIELTATPGPSCRFGDVTVEGNRNLSSAVVREAAAIERGSLFSLNTLSDARLAIYALGPFASVETEHFVRPDSPVVDVVIRVVPGRMFRLGVGLGMSAGQETAQGTGDSYSQWDVHLLGRIEHKNFLGGMRRLQVEDRPRLIFDQPFPETSRHDFGNLLTIELRQPAFIEPRTTLVARARWDRGPDPYGGRFLRHDIVVGIGPERYFFHGKLLLASNINTDLFLPDTDPQPPYPNTELAYLDHTARLDLRDDPRNTHSGSYFSFGVQHAGYFLPSDWNYVRLTQDSRGYLLLPGGLVLAGRTRLGFMVITDTTIAVPTQEVSAMTANSSVDPRYLEELAKLGPLGHRLRGGGHNSVRGYAPNTLGDAEVIGKTLVSGGLRQWEASLELRIPITESFGTVAFVDAGDVSRGTSYRFEYPQTSFGIGLRYLTIVGPLRLDGALAPSSLQVIGTDRRIRTGLGQSRLLGFANGALSFTIGEAF
jgi:outer membrane protein insertion porin family/translocation and assembly module TamA